MTKSEGCAATATSAVLDMLEKHDPAEIITKTYFKPFKTDRPIDGWSFGNQMICLGGYLNEHPEADPYEAMDTLDCRGFRQWEQVERHVTKGEHAYTFIFNPLTKKVTDKSTGDENYIVSGFKTTPVFTFEQTNGEDLPEKAQDPRQEVIRKFDFLNVAEKLGIHVHAGVSGHGEYGSYHSARKAIKICSPEEMTFFHELAHAVDDHLLIQATGKGLKGGQHVNQEIIAQFCSNVLGYLTGKEVERTTAYTKQYISGYLDSKNITRGVMELMARINNVIDFIITNSELHAGSGESAEMATSMN